MSKKHVSFSNDEFCENDGRRIMAMISTLDYDDEFLDHTAFTVYESDCEYNSFSHFCIYGDCFYGGKVTICKCNDEKIIYTQERMQLNKKYLITLSNENTRLIIKYKNLFCHGFIYKYLYKMNKIYNLCE